jgi:bacterioferritin
LKGTAATHGGIVERLKLHLNEELAHRLEVAKQIDYLGGDPTVKVKRRIFPRF